MSDFSKPRTIVGLKLRQKAAYGASARAQDIYEGNVDLTDPNITDGAKALAYQLRSNRVYLNEFASGQLKKLIHSYGPEEKSGTAGSYLARLGSELNLSIGQLLETGGELKAVKALLRKRKEM